VDVVDPLEVVQVEEDHGQRRQRPSGLSEHPLERVVERPAVWQAGQRVGRRAELCDRQRPQVCQRQCCLADRLDRAAPVGLPNRPVLADENRTEAGRRGPLSPGSVIRPPAVWIPSLVGVAGYVGILSIELHFPEAGSLKGKRKHVQSARAQLQNRFGASVAEVDHHDLWQRSGLVMACSAREVGELHVLLDDAERWLHAQDWDVSRVERRIVSLDD
jgi:uncharacterized protein